MAKRKPRGRDYTGSVRRQFEELIHKNYRSVEQFAYAHDLNKSTLSRLLSGERSDYMVSTLGEIARALGKKLVIKLE